VSHSDDLLAVAKKYELSSTEAEKRRCISTAYYAVFHLVVEQVAKKFVPGNNHAQNMVRRAVAHTLLKDICGQMVNLHKQRATPGSWRNAGYEDTVASELANLATLLCDLQKWREIADYDLAKEVSQAEAESQLQRAQEVFDTINAGLPEPQWTLFLTSLLIKERK
jgi:uncharacterized protein (UPF0332 family)